MMESMNIPEEVAISTTVKDGFSIKPFGITASTLFCVSLLTMLDRYIEKGTPFRVIIEREEGAPNIRVYNDTVSKSTD